MNLTKEEKNLLAIEKFLHKLKDDFPSIDKIYLTIPDIRDCTNLFKPKKDVFPLSVHITHNKTTSYYSWNPNPSDDEFPVYNYEGEHFGYHKFKEYVKENLFEAFAGKSFYAEERHINFDNISLITQPIKNKLMAIELNQTLDKKDNQPKIKVNKI